MKSLFAFLLLISALSAAEFPNLLSHIQLTWSGTDMTSKIDASQTFSLNGNVSAFIFCGEFNSTASQIQCSSVYSYSIETGDHLISGSGNGNRSYPGFISQTGQQYCLSFYNFIPNFKEVYDAAEISQGKWTHTWNCERKSTSSSDWVGLIWGMIIMILVIVGGFAFYKYDEAFPEKTRPIKEWLDCCMPMFKDCC